MNRKGAVLLCMTTGHSWHNTRWDFWIAILWMIVANVGASIVCQLLGLPGIVTVVIALVVGICTGLLSAWFADRRGVVCLRCGVRRS